MNELSILLHQVRDSSENVDEFVVKLVANRSGCIWIIYPKFRTEESLGKLEINPFILKHIENGGQVNSSLKNLKKRTI